METKVPFHHFVELFTDGACIGNPGPGGWGFILKHPKSGRKREGSGGERHTTNNRMEITAVIRGIEALKRPCKIHLYSDSQYVLNSIEKWMAKWKRFNWRRSATANATVKNVDLWIRLDELLQPHKIKTTWVRGHAGHKENERCDQLAQTAAERIAKTPRPDGIPRTRLAGAASDPMKLFAAGSPMEDHGRP